MSRIELERLFAEAIPDGTFGGPKPARKRTEPLPDPNAAQHCRELLAALRDRRPVARGDPGAVTGVDRLVGP